ncbi:hypothetical protein TSTA_110900 [Talaromyces stipitatus ATCC 10500]|uniref:Uncharacterized protein n=1 Tax=Talaromyces stipitatus (strain ATCC 10500 / CBS 375.48 / QM 6759 / NRRL 1006) TaxID=441959 RepID=B8MV21_TALSN|nr:uncharacterized protein TSTA_110900 [Talaromyces stipitatus ATCC 10500]EED11911.1 hypothetical protein TSTA_110900 [Talaromyces stipitatus ATCC 10500]
MASHKSPTQQTVSESSRRLSSKLKQEQDGSITVEEDDPDCEQCSTPIFIHEGVFIGFWFADQSGNGRRPVYCLINRDFEFAYLKGKTFILVRYDDFDPLDEFGDWLGDDTEDEDAMSPEDVKGWVQMMWEIRNYAGIQDMTLED